MSTAVSWISFPQSAVNESSASPMVRPTDWRSPAMARNRGLPGSLSSVRMEMDVMALSLPIYIFYWLIILLLRSVGRAQQLGAFEGGTDGRGLRARGFRHR